MILPDWLPIEAWEAFLAMRKAKKNPLNTDRMIKRQIDRLDKFRLAGYSVEESLDASTNGKWDDTYPPKPALPAVSQVGARAGESDQQFRLRVSQNQYRSLQPKQAEPEPKSVMPAELRKNILDMVKSKIVH